MATRSGRVYQSGQQDSHDPSLDRLPAELWDRVACRLSPIDAKACRLVCKGWRLRFVSPALTGRVRCAGSPISAYKSLYHQLHRVSVAYPLLQSLKLEVAVEPDKNVALDLTEDSDLALGKPTPFTIVRAAKELAAKLPHLRQLTLEGEIQDHTFEPLSVSPLSVLTGLTSLDLERCQHRSADLPLLAQQLSRLVSLKLAHASGGERCRPLPRSSDLASLSVLRELRHLTVKLGVSPRAEPLTSRLEVIGTLTQLTSLELKVPGCPPLGMPPMPDGTAQGIAALGNLCRLQRLDMDMPWLCEILHSTPMEEDQQYADALATMFGGMSALGQLQYNVSGLSFKSVTRPLKLILQHCAALKCLHLRPRSLMEVDPELAALLAKVPEVHVNVASPKILPRGLSSLAAISSVASIRWPPYGDITGWQAKGKWQPGEAVPCLA